MLQLAVKVFLNLGIIEYKPIQNCTVNLVGYHLSGLFDDELNKQNYLGGFGGYRNLAPSIGLNVSWQLGQTIHRTEERR